MTPNEDTIGRSTGYWRRVAQARSGEITALRESLAAAHQIIPCYESVYQMMREQELVGRMNVPSPATVAQEHAA